MDNIYEYLGGGVGIGGIVFSFWIKSYLQGLKEEKKKIIEDVKKANEENIKQEIEIKRNKDDIQKLKDKIYS
jgi:hypothetical protein